MINVPTMVWIDEDGRIVRPNDQQFGTDMFVQLTGKPSAPFLAALRAWVNEGRGALAADEVREQQLLPTPEHQLARAEFRSPGSSTGTAKRRRRSATSLRAGGLAPNDWTIRRAQLPIRGIDPMTSNEFIALWEEGIPQYPTRTSPRSEAMAVAVRRNKATEPSESTRGMIAPAGTRRRRPFGLTPAAPGLPSTARGSRA